MNTNIKRRDVIKVAIAAGGLFALRGMASEPQNQPIASFAGSWFYQGQPCAIFQQGAVLLVVNEVGSLATAREIDHASFIILGGAGWDSGLVANVTNHGRTINWSNNSIWTR